VRSFQGDENQGGRQRGHGQQPGSGRRAIAAVAKIAAAVVIPLIISPLPTARPNTIPPPINSMPVTAPATAFGEPAPARLPRTADAVPMSEKVRSPAGDPRELALESEGEGQRKSNDHANQQRRGARAVGHLPSPP